MDSYHVYSVFSPTARVSDVQPVTSPRPAAGYGEQPQYEPEVANVAEASGHSADTSNLHKGQSYHINSYRGTYKSYRFS